MYEIKTDALKGFIDSLTTILREEYFVFDGQYLKATGVDSANVCLVTSMIKVVGEPATIGVDLITLKGIVGKFTDPVTSVKIDGSTLTLVNGNVKYSTPEVVNIRRAHCPTLNYSVIVDVPAKQVNDAVKLIKAVADKITIHWNQESSTIRLNGVCDNNVMDITIDCEPQDVQSCKSLFSIDYIDDIISALKVFQTIRIGMGNDYPMTMSGKTEDLLVSFIVSPRIES